MREPLRDKLRLEHMVDAIGKVNGFMSGKDASDLRHDCLLLFGVVKGLEIIGEAAYKLTKEFKETHTGIPWGLIVGLRHVLVHGYYQVRPEEVALIVKNDLPTLKPILEQYLEEME